MRITIKLFATFRTGRFDVETRPLPPGATVGAAIEELRIPRRELGIVLVNSVHASPDKVLEDGDTLALFPLVGGG